MTLRKLLLGLLGFPLLEDTVFVRIVYRGPQGSMLYAKMIPIRNIFSSEGPIICIEASDIDDAVQHQ